MRLPPAVGDRGTDDRRRDPAGTPALSFRRLMDLDLLRRLGHVQLIEKYLDYHDDRNRQERAEKPVDRAADKEGNDHQDRL